MIENKDALVGTLLLSSSCSSPFRVASLNVSLQGRLFGGCAVPWLLLQQRASLTSDGTHSEYSIQLTRRSISFAS